MNEKPMLICQRLADMKKVHPNQITGTCTQCGETVGIYPSGQQAMKKYPDIELYCQVCKHPGKNARLAPGAEAEAAQSRYADPASMVIAVQHRAAQAGQLTTWTIYDHPRDMPDVFVARCFVTANGAPQATPYSLASPDLETIRTTLQDAGLWCIHRSPDDHETVVETWV